MVAWSVWCVRLPCEMAVDECCCDVKLWSEVPRILLRAWRDELLAPSSTGKADFVSSTIASYKSKSPTYL